MISLLVAAVAFSTALAAARDPHRTPPARATAGRASCTAAKTAGDPITLSVQPGYEHPTYSFGLKRGPSKPIVLHFDANHSLSNQSVQVLQTALTSSNGDEIGPDQLSGSAQIAGCLVSFALTVDPKDTSPGSYRGNVEIVGVPPANIITARAPVLTIVLKPIGWKQYVVAFFLILIGAFVGFCVKWLSETGRKRARIRRRLNTIAVRFSEYRRRTEALPGTIVPPVIPERLQRVLTAVKTDVESGDTDKATTTIATVTDEKLDAVFDALDDITESRRELARQWASIDKMTALTSETGEKLRNVVHREEEFLSDDVEALWPTTDSASAASDRKLHDGWIEDYSQFLSAR